MIETNIMIASEKVRSKYSKRKDPDYVQLIGDIPVTLATEFKALCVLNHLSVSEGMENALKEWVKEKKSQNPFQSNNSDE